MDQLDDFSFQLDHSEYTTKIKQIQILFDVSKIQVKSHKVVRSQTRLRYIADRVLRSSYDMFHKAKEDMMDDLSALGLRHVGYGVPIELFAPFTDSSVIVMKSLISEVAQDASRKKKKPSRFFFFSDERHMSPFGSI